MAVKQISRIQHRRGKKDHLPSSLNEGELGYTTDTGQIFIGAPNFPFSTNRNNNFPFRNIEILTELSNISRQTSTKYSFELNRASTATPSWSVPRVLQSKLDDFVSVKDYGAIGDGNNDDTISILQAIVDTSKEQLSSKNNGRLRGLYFPAGVYKITQPLIIPPGTYWYGEGNTGLHEAFKNKNANVSSSVILADFSDKNFDPYDSVLVSYDSSVTETTNINDIDQNNRNLGIDANLPEDILIRDISFIAKNYSSRKNSGINVARLDRVKRVYFDNCSFEGEETFSSSTDSYNKIYDSIKDSLAILIDGFGNVSKPEDILFNNCIFTKLNRAFVPTDEIKNITITNSIFESLFKAISIGEHEWEENFSGGLPSDLSQSQTIEKPGNKPTRPFSFKCFYNKFNNIFSHAFSVYSKKDENTLYGTGHTSSYNSFINVGNENKEWNDNSIEPLHSSIHFEKNSKYNQSIGDMFFYDGKNDQKRISFKLNDFNLIMDPQLWHNSNTELFLPTEKETLTDSSISSISNITFDPQEANNIIFKYSIERDSEVRIGKMHITSKKDGSNLNYTDFYNETDDIGFILNVIIDSSNKIVINFSDQFPSGSDAELSWNVEKWIS